MKQILDIDSVTENFEKTCYHKCPNILLIVYDCIKHKHQTMLITTKKQTITNYLASSETFQPLIF